ncbi:hypothetical protein DPMN_051466 [Dreissena polymorpha]|uniref:Uncharacterized protein n=1 Tax=Dreissena polymorpha TaxID=45954 RepID=A0A9D4HNC0_DREPO|nr:hypothetical protein DPMN_051466 [Dreissena polymorpha]
MATSAEPDMVGLPQEYTDLSVSALEMKTLMKLASYLDRKGKLLNIEIDNTSTDIMNDFTGLAKLAGQTDYLDTVKFQ